MFIEKIRYLREKSKQGILSITGDGSILVLDKKTGTSKRKDRENIGIERGHRFKKEIILFALSLKGPVDETRLARLWYEDEMPEKFNKFWTEKQVETTLRFLHKLGIDLSSISIQKSHPTFHRAAVHKFGTYSKLLKACNIEAGNRQKKQPINAIEFYNRLYQAHKNGEFRIKDGQIWVKKTTGEEVPGTIKKNTVYVPNLRIEGGRYHEAKLKFVCEFSGPYNEKNFAEYWYKGKLPLTKKQNGFWTKKQAEAIIEILIEHGVNFEPQSIYDTYPDLYGGLADLFGSYWEALQNLKINPKEVYQLFKVDRRLFGIYVERCVWEIIRKSSSCFDFQTSRESLRLDLWHKEEKKVIDIKTSIHTSIDKEISKYVPKYGAENVITVFLYGPEDFNQVIEGVRKISIFQWIQENSKDFDDFQSVIEQLKKFKDENEYETGDPKKTAAYFFDMTNNVIELALDGKSHQKIADMVYISRRQVGRILDGQTLAPYINSKLFSQYQKEKKKLKDEKEKRNLLILEFHNKGFALKDIANEVKMSPTGVKDVLQVMMTKEQEPKGDRSIRVYEINGQGEINERNFKIYPSAPSCARALGVSKHTIGRVLRGIPAMSNLPYVILYNETFTEERLQQRIHQKLQELRSLK